MPDPTPTPDTLRAALEAFDRIVGKINVLRAGRQTHQDVETVRAALAASPAPTDSPACADMGHEWESWVCRRCGATFGAAPTDSPDERHDTSCEQTVGFVSCNCCQRRPAAVTAPREDEHDETCGPMQYVPGAMCRLPKGHDGAHNAYRPVTSTPIRIRPCRAAAPAVERATPDPDVISLAALIHDTLWNARNAVTKDSAQLLARALIAAGVTLNETATTPTQEDAK